MMTTINDQLFWYTATGQDGKTYEAAFKLSMVTRCVIGEKDLLLGMADWREEYREVTIPKGNRSVVELRKINVSTEIYLSNPMDIEKFKSTTGYDLVSESKPQEVVTSGYIAADLPKTLEHEVI